MFAKTVLSLSALSALARFVAAEAMVEACKTGACYGDCDYSFGLGSGYPECIIYTTDEFAADGYTPGENGGTDVYFNFDDPGEGCAYIVRTPAYSDQVGCGINVLSVRNPSCSRVTIQQTFVTQFCCGTDDCNGAGAGNGKRDASGATGMIMFANGTELAPLGYHPAPVEEEKREIVVRSRTGAPLSNPLTKRDCVFTPSGGSYTVPGTTEVVDPNIQNGPAMVEISHEVSTSYTTTISAGLSFEVFSAGFEFSIEESVSDTLSFTYEVQDGQSGVVTWTPILTCYDGATTGCSADDNQSGNFCYATRASDGTPVGQYSLQQRA